MTDVARIDSSEILAHNGDLAAQAFIDGAKIDTNLQVLRARLNLLIAALTVSIADDNTLEDAIVHLRQLGTDVAEIIASPSGWQPKVAVAVATTANVTLSGEQTIDGVLTSASRILVKNQTLPANNGIYTTAAGAWARTTDMDTAAEIGRAAVTILGGTTQAGQNFVVTALAEDITLGTTAIDWAKFGGSEGNSAAVQTIITGGTGVTTAADIPSARRRMARVVLTSNISLSAPGVTLDGVTMATDDRVLLVGQSTASQNGLWLWKGSATLMVRTGDYVNADTLMAFNDLEVGVREGTAGRGTVWRLATAGAITIDTTSTSWLQSPHARPVTLLPVRAAVLVNVTISSPGATLDGLTMAVGDRVLLAAQSTASQNGLWIFQGTSSAMTRPLDWSPTMTVQAFPEIRVPVTDGTSAGLTWQLSTTALVTIDTTATVWVISVDFLLDALPACVVAATSNISISSPAATLDGVTLVTGQRILLTAQTAPAQNGPWIFRGAATAMTRPLDFSSFLVAQPYLGVTVYVQYGPNAGTWRVTTTGNITVDTTSVAFALAFHARTGENAICNPCGIVAENVDHVATVTNTFAYGKVATWKGALLAGTSVAGTLTQGTGRSIGRTGFSILWSGVTLVGSSPSVKFRFFLRAAEAVRFKNQTAAISYRAKHDTGAGVVVTTSISKATASDNFAGVTQISTQDTTVSTGTDTFIPFEQIAMGDCSNGLQIDISFAPGAITSKAFEITEVQLELGGLATPIEIWEAERTLIAEEFYFQAFGGGSAVVLLLGQAVSTTEVHLSVPFRRKMRDNGGGPAFAGAAADYGLTTSGGGTTACNAVPTAELATDQGFGLRATIAAASLTAGHASRLSLGVNAVLRVHRGF